jgi:hypothetical protein
MTSPRSNKPLILALWANAALLAVIALLLVNRGGVPSFLPAAYAQNQPPIAGGAGIFVMPGQFRENVWGCYLLDVDSKTLCAYQYFPGEKKLRLAAARSYRSDVKLDNFNTDPSPNEIKALVERQQAGGAAAPAAPAPPAAGEGKDH